MSTTPTNTNLLFPNRYVLSFDRLAGMQFFCQSITLPGLNIGTAIQSTPFIDITRAGDKLTYDTLTVSFLVDEDLNSWKEIHDWIRGMAFPTKFEEYQNLKTLSRKSNPIHPQYSDAQLVLLGSNQQGIFRFHFFDLFPTSLGAITLASTSGPLDNVLVADGTFAFSYFDIIKIKK